MFFSTSNIYAQQEGVGISEDVKVQVIHPSNQTGMNNISKIPEFPTSITVMTLAIITTISFFSINRKYGRINY